MKKCRFILDNNEAFNYNLTKDRIYKYEICEGDFYPYYIYVNENLAPLATFSKSHFNKIFIDIAYERKLKLEKLNSL